MPKTIHIRPTPQPEGERPLVVYLINGAILPTEGRRVEVDRHVRMLLRDGDVETKSTAPSNEPAPTHKPARAKEQSE